MDKKFHYNTQEPLGRFCSINAGTTSHCNLFDSTRQDMRAIALHYTKTKMLAIWQSVGSLLYGDNSLSDQKVCAFLTSKAQVELET